MTTYPGQSGCPVVYGDKAIAIHIQSGELAPDKTFLYNVGRLVTLDMLKNIKKWSEQMQADPFKLDMENICPHLR